ncbi:hypothetical protein FQZ97_820530 [compost metagenome]
MRLSSIPPMSTLWWARSCSMKRSSPYQRVIRLSSRTRSKAGMNRNSRPATSSSGTQITSSRCTTWAHQKGSRRSSRFRPPPSTCRACAAAGKSLRRRLGKSPARWNGPACPCTSIATAVAMRWRAGFRSSRASRCVGVVSRGVSAAGRLGPSPSWGSRRVSRKPLRSESAAVRCSMARYTPGVASRARTPGAWDEATMNTASTSWRTRASRAAAPLRGDHRTSSRPMRCCESRR